MWGLIWRLFFPLREDPAREVPERYYWALDNPDSSLADLLERYRAVDAACARARSEGRKPPAHLADELMGGS